MGKQRSQKGFLHIPGRGWNPMGLSVNQENSFWYVDVDLLGSHSRSLDSHPKEIFFKCLYIIIKKDKENTQYGWPKSSQIYKNNFLQSLCNFVYVFWWWWCCFLSWGRRQSLIKVNKCQITFRGSPTLRDWLDWKSWLQISLKSENI